MKLTGLSNEQLLSDLHALIGQGRKVLAGLLAYLGEVEQRRLDLKSACSSLFDFAYGGSGWEMTRRAAALRVRASSGLTLPWRGTPCRSR